MTSRTFAIAGARAAAALLLSLSALRAQPGPPWGPGAGAAPPPPPPPAMAPAPAPVEPYLVGDVPAFYDDLASYGQWLVLPQYGWVWIPANVPPGWRPYTVGRWVYTEEYGWTWVSNFEWGWAPFHYGRWDFSPQYGWFWLPGTVWAPAWVAWRCGNGFIGWAPLSPAFTVRTIQVVVTEEQVMAIPPHWWCFVGEREILQPEVRRFVLPAARNVTLVPWCRNVTAFRVYDDRIINVSLQLEVVERMTGHEIPRFHAIDRGSLREQRGVLGDDQVALYRPRVARVTHEDLAHRHEEERRQLDQHLDTRRAQLEDLHKKEMDNPPHGLSKDQVRQHQETEKKAMEEQAARERQVLKNWHDRQTKGEISPTRSRFAAPQGSSRQAGPSEPTRQGFRPSGGTTSNPAPAPSPAKASPPSAGKASAPSSGKAAGGAGRGGDSRKTEDGGRR